MPPVDLSLQAVFSCLYSVLRMKKNDDISAFDILSDRKRGITL